jgi:hypothetical protein
MRRDLWTPLVSKPSRTNWPTPLNKTNPTFVCFFMIRIRSLVALFTLPAVAFAVDNDVLFPIPAEVREILDARCVMCHGEVIDGEAEIREDLIMITDEQFKETLSDPEYLYELILEDEMPQEARLSFRLRRNPEMRERLNTLIEAYEANNEKAVLIKWLEASLAKAE